METQSNNSPLILLYKISAAASLIAGMLLLIGMKSLIVSFLHLGTISSLFSTFPDNWLIVIFKLQAGFSGVKINLLTGLDVLDITLLALACIMFLGLYTALRRTNEIWSIVAAIQPFLGMVLFIVTKNAGRSAMMGAALVISLVMLKSTSFKKSIAALGIASSAMLLIGDFTAGVFPSIMIAALFAVAYVIFTAWFFLIAFSLFYLGQSGSGNS